MASVKNEPIYRPEIWMYENDCDAHIKDFKRISTPGSEEMTDSLREVCITNSNGDKVKFYQANEKLYLHS